MIKRFFSFYNKLNLLLVLGFFYLVILMPSESELLVGYIQNISAMVFMTFVVLSINLEPIMENWKYIRSGLLVDRADAYLTKANRRLKEARLGETNPLFVATKDEFFYYDDNYSNGVS